MAKLFNPHHQVLMNKLVEPFRHNHDHRACHHLDHQHHDDYRHPVVDVKKKNFRQNPLPPQAFYCSFSTWHEFSKVFYNCKIVYKDCVPYSKTSECCDKTDFEFSF